MSRTSQHLPGKTGLPGMSIRRKLLTMIMAVCSAALIVFVTLILAFLMSLYQKRMAAELASITRMIASNCSAAVQFDDSRDAGAVLEALSTCPTVVYACIKRTDGTTLADYHRDGFREKPQPPPELGQQRRYDDAMVALEPIRVNGRIIGAVFVQSDLTELSSFRNRILATLAAMLLGVLLVAYLLSAKLQRLISGPLEHLTRVTRDISASRDYSLRASVAGGDEIGLLTQGFNAMLSEIEHRDAALRQARKTIANIINSMPSVLVGVDSDAVVTHWNDEAARLTGLSSEEAVGKSLPSVMPRMEPDMGGVTEAISSRQMQYIKRQSKDDTGKTRFEEVTIFPLIANGIDGAVIRVDDVTARIQLEEQLHQARKMDAIGQLAGGVAHDFNNMLGGIMGGAELLEEWIPEGEPKPREYLDMIQTSANRAAKLASQLLAFGRKQAKSSTAVDLHKVVADTVAILENTIGKRIVIELHLDAETPTVVGSPSHLQNALLNLGINACHAMPEGGTLTFGSSTTTLDPIYCQSSTFELTPGKYIELTVRDTGCGIPMHLQKRIFEPFFTTKPQGEGTGLGLSAAYGTISQHGGEIKVYSEEGVGTCFHILLPLSEKASEREPFVVHRHIGSGLVLVVDDEPIMRATAKAYLEGYGYEILLAADGEEAVAMYRERAKEIDLVICDMIMPRMNGRDCFKALREINPRVRFVLSSGFTRPQDIADMKTEGLAGFLQKPFRGAQLSTVVAMAMETAGCEFPESEPER
ncbi:MAG: response regulator [Lentisphaeria bacterium]|nr:response regulator [Lentisphaeria bacterium]